MRAARFRVEGIVQGVGYRRFAQVQAISLGIAGWVRNTGDGAVEGHAQGDDLALATFQAHLRAGPARAVVTQLVVTPTERGEFRVFEIRH